jgi:predicted aspartyl protease
LIKEAGTFKVPVQINGVIELNFVLDSGASDVSIPADVVMTLLRTGSLKKDDFLGTKTYVLADGSSVPSATFRIRMLKVGNRVIENVVASVVQVGDEVLRRHAAGDNCLNMPSTLASLPGLGCVLVNRDW